MDNLWDCIMLYECMYIHTDNAWTYSYVVNQSKRTRTYMCIKAVHIIQYVCALLLHFTYVRPYIATNTLCIHTSTPLQGLAKVNYVSM